jgi:hypothetical protein
MDEHWYGYLRCVHDVAGGRGVEVGLVGMGIGRNDHPSFAGRVPSNAKPAADDQGTDGGGVETDRSPESERVRGRVVDEDGAGVTLCRAHDGLDRGVEQRSELEVGGGGAIDLVEGVQPRELGGEHGLIGVP